MSEKSPLSHGTAIAGTAVALAVLDHLHEKGILSTAEKTSVIDRAISYLNAVLGTPEGYAAQNLLIGLRSEITDRGQKE